MWKSALAAVVMIALTGCAADQAAPSASTPRSATTMAPASSTVSSRPEPSSTPTAADTTTTTLRRIDLEFNGGEVVGPGVFEVALGDIVDLWVLSGIDDEVHVHGYDLFFDLRAGIPFNLSFLADVPGVFEVEAHTGRALLFELEVTG